MSTFWWKNEFYWIIWSIFHKVVISCELSNAILQGCSYHSLFLQPNYAAGFMTNNICKVGNSSVFKPKIHDLYLREVSIQEQVIMAQAWSCITPAISGWNFWFWITVDRPGCASQLGKGLCKKDSWTLSRALRKSPQKPGASRELRLRGPVETERGDLELAANCTM